MTAMPVAVQSSLLKLTIIRSGSFADVLHNNSASREPKNKSGGQIQIHWGGEKVRVCVHRCVTPPWQDHNRPTNNVAGIDFRPSETHDMT